MYCIYQITNKINGHKYIGQHKYEDESNPMGRYKGSGLLLHKAYKKYGIENFETEILYKRVRDKATIDAMEIWAIEKYKPEYNIAKGGSGGDTRSGLSEESKKMQSDRISKALKGRKAPWAGFDKINRTKFWNACWNNWVKFNMSIIKSNDHFANHKNCNKLSTYWNAYTEYYISIYKRKEYEEKIKNGYFKGIHKGFVSHTCWKKVIHLGIKVSPRRRSKKIRIGDEEITRESLPSMQAWMLNPSHTEQGIQDILDATLGNRIIQNPQMGADQAGLQGTSEIRNNVWENK